MYISLFAPSAIKQEAYEATEEIEVSPSRV